jgi:hypothetical protein
VLVGMDAETGWLCSLATDIGRMCCTCYTQVFHPSIDAEGHVDLSTICEDWSPSHTIKTVIFGLNRLFLLPHTGEPSGWLLMAAA